MAKSRLLHFFSGQKWVRRTFAQLIFEQKKIWTAVKQDTSKELDQRRRKMKFFEFNFLFLFIILFNLDLSLCRGRSEKSEREGKRNQSIMFYLLIILESMKKKILTRPIIQNGYPD